MAVSGEWIFALRQSPVDIDATYQSEIRTITEEFLETSYSVCMNDEDLTILPPSQTQDESTTTSSEETHLTSEHGASSDSGMLEEPG